MKKGIELHSVFYSRGTINIIGNKRVKESTFSKLSNLGLITYDRTIISKTGTQRQFYKLTEAGLNH